MNLIPTPRCRAFSLCCFLASGLWLILLCNPQPAHATAYYQQSRSSNEQQSIGQQLAKESREAAGEDENAQFKYSSSVQFVSKLTGLSLEHAYWLCASLNFAVVAILIVWVLKKNLPAVFGNRTASIQKAMEEARKTSEEANRRLADIESRLSKLDIEIANMRGAAEAEGIAEDQRIMAAAKEDARKIVESAEQEILAIARMARGELMAYAADLAVSLAKKQIHVDAATDQVLIHRFVQQLPFDDDQRKGGK